MIHWSFQPTPTLPQALLELLLQVTSSPPGPGKEIVQTFFRWRLSIDDTNARKVENLPLTCTTLGKKEEVVDLRIVFLCRCVQGFILSSSDHDLRLCVVDSRE